MLGPILLVADQSPVSATSGTGSCDDAYEVPVAALSKTLSFESTTKDPSTDGKEGLALEDSASGENGSDTFQGWSDMTSKTSPMLQGFSILQQRVRRMNFVWPQPRRWLLQTLAVCHMPFWAACEDGLSGDDEDGICEEKGLTPELIADEREVWWTASLEERSSGDTPWLLHTTPSWTGTALRTSAHEAAGGTLLPESGNAPESAWPDIGPHRSPESAHPCSPESVHLSADPG
jgi:hypothetical protein